MNPYAIASWIWLASLVGPVVGTYAWLWWRARGYEQRFHAAMNDVAGEK